MMSTPVKTPFPPDNGVDQFSVPPEVPSAPHPIPFQFQWNMVPGPSGTHVFSSSSPWVVPQVGPPNFPSTSTNQWNVQPIMTGQNIPNDIIPQLTGVTACHETFVKGKPKALGIVMIVTSICQILFAISLPFMTLTVTFISGIPFWGPFFYILAGSFTIRAQRMKTIRLVKSSYGLNIVSSIFSFTAIIINIVDFAVIQCEEYYQCHDEGAGAYTIVSILLVLNLLVFCLAVSLAVFGGRALDHVPSNVSPVFVIQNVIPVPPSAHPPTSSEISIPPPPYVVQDEDGLKNAGC